jgi:hypothetical protein
VVNTVNDKTDPAGSTTVSLRDAVAMANKSFPPTTIAFDPHVFATARTITLKGSALILTNPTSISIVGPAAGVTINGNSKSDEIDILTGVRASLSRLTLTGGVTGIFDAGTTFVTNCSITNNSGSGIVANAGFMVLTGDTISGNQSNDVGGGVVNELGKMTLIDCTVTGNSAFSSGGGIENGVLDGIATMTLLDCTISGNTSLGSLPDGTGGGGIGNGATLFAANSIIAGNIDQFSIADFFGPVTSLGFNLVGESDFATGWISTDLTGTSAKPLNAKLGKLANNGGPTQTLLPLSGSPAINHGSNALVPQGLTTDQRGLPRIVGGVVDIGAVEVQT